MGVFARIEVETVEALKRSNIESTFSAVKRKFGDAVLSVWNSPTA